jgi:hypothetical protein
MSNSDSSTSTTQPAPSYTLQVDFSWKAFHSLITEKDDPQSKTKYIVDYKSTKPHLVFKHGEGNFKFASGTLHPISINADCEINGKATVLKALKRFKTEYTHLSYAYSNSDTPVPMSWTSTSNFKTWDFICLDDKGVAVAKFAARNWSTNRVGYVEFMGPKDTISDAVRDEIVVTGITLFYCMVLRATSPLSLVGAVFSKPGKIAPTTVPA